MTFLAIWTFIRKFWKPIAIALAVLIVCIFVYRACNKPPKLDEVEIQRGEQAVKERNDKVLKEILANSDLREKEIDHSVKAAEEARRQAVANYDGLTTEQLAQELERRK